jgi:hypothetical protein
MKKLCFVFALLAACSESVTPGYLTVTSAGGRVVAYETGWKQGYVVGPAGARGIAVAGRPTLGYGTPDGRRALLVDREAGLVTAVEVTTGTVARYRIRTNRDLPEFSRDSRYVLFHASGRFAPSGTYDPNELSLVDLESGEHADLSVGTNPKAIAFYERDGDPRMLLFSPGKMTQIRIRELFAAAPSDDRWKQTRDLSATVRAGEVPRVVAQTGTHLYLVIAGIKEFLSIDLTSPDDLPPVNFEINDVRSPRWLALSPPVPATAETVFFRDVNRDTQFLYVLNDNQTLTVFDTQNLGRSRIIDLTYVSDKPDRVFATPDGKRVLMYQSKGARALYRMNVRTGNISTIPFKYAVSEFLIAPDGESVVAMHDPTEKQPRPSFTYVNFTEVFDPILLPGTLVEYALTPDGEYVVFRSRGSEPMRVFNLKRGLLDEARSQALAAYDVRRIGAVAGGQGIYAWLDDPLGRVAFLPLSGPERVVGNFVVDGLLDR